MAGAIICVSIAKRLGLSSVIGYLLAGVLIGPYILGFIGEEGEDILHFAEFGVVVMLFLIGLEIEPKNFWNMRKAILGMGSIQVGGTMLLSYILFTLLGFDWKVSLVISMAVALSSTAIALQTIKEKGMMETTFGSSSFSILLFQDIIVIFMLGFIPLLANTENGDSSKIHSEQTSLLESLPMGFQTLAIILSVVLIIIAGRYLIVPMLRKVAKTGVRELLIAAALLIVLGISFLMEFVGISPALGAFLGGVVLSNSEFKHELESTLEPFKNNLYESLHAIIFSKLEHLKQNETLHLRYERKVVIFLNFKSLLEANFSTNRNADFYAKKLNITYKHLNEICKEILNVTAKQFIDAFVILEAKRLLINSEIKSTELAYKLGFQEPTNFVKYFKKHTKFTPNSFKKEYI
ncbi:monovalent cation:proton antiporter-2 (CPA2) family protein [Lacinutrix venerupis]|nr:monovalent cation:proton antiporter-2 (CPA2) family protein [Lacinutrix venerupis]